MLVSHCMCMSCIITKPIKILISPILPHSQLHSPRPPLTDVPAVYFVSPTLANIKRISEDLEKCLYESFHFNFVEPLPRALLEELAASAARDGTGDLIEQVLDQYLSFIAPSPSLFSLLPPPQPTNPTSPLPTSPAHPHSSYAILNSPSSSEQQIEDEIERIASGLFSAVVTNGESFAEFALILDLNVREYRPRPLHPCTQRKRCRNDCQEIRDQNSRCAINVISFSWGIILSFCSRLHRPLEPPETSYALLLDSPYMFLFNSCYPAVLLILDRNIDLVSMLSHGWTYQALVSDCLSLSLNRVTLASSETQLQKRSYDLDSKDFFWSRNAANPFPQVAEEIDTELNKYKVDAAEITRSTGVSDVNDISQLYVYSRDLGYSGLIILLQGFIDKCCSPKDCYHAVT